VIDFDEEFLKTEALLHQAMIRLLAFIEERKELFSIVIAELLKDTERRTLLLSHLNEVLLRHDRYIPQLKPMDDSRQGAVVEFFTGFLPFIMFVLLKESWKKLYGQGEAELNELFLAAFEATHVRYTLEMMKQSSAQGEEEGKEP
jgi:hypothetical protein